MSVCAKRSGAVMCPAFCARLPMAAGPDAIRGLNPIHVRELGALTMPWVLSIPVSTGLHHVIATLPKRKKSILPGGF
jgi:hypothetical protein